MPEIIEENAPKTKKRNERTEAKFFEDADKLIAEAEREAADYVPPNEIAQLDKLKTKRAAVLAARGAHQQNRAGEETKRNNRERLYKPVRTDVSALIAYAKSAGKAANDIDALRSIARDVSGKRAKPVSQPIDGASGGATNTISVSQLSYASIADHYSRFIEQYDSLSITTSEPQFKAVTHRAKLADIRQANAEVIASVADTNSTGEALDKLAFTDDDSLLNACISAKQYIKSKFGVKSEAYKNIAKTRFIMPSRFR